MFYAKNHHSATLVFSDGYC